MPSGRIRRLNPARIGPGGGWRSGTADTRDTPPGRPPPRLALGGASRERPGAGVRPWSADSPDDTGAPGGRQSPADPWAAHGARLTPARGGSFGAHSTGLDCPQLREEGTDM